MSALKQSVAADIDTRGMELLHADRQISDIL